MGTLDQLSCLFLDNFVVKLGRFVMSIAKSNELSSNRFQIILCGCCNELSSQ